MFYVSSIFTLIINLLFEKYFLRSYEKLPKSQKHMINQFLAHVPILYSLKTPGILWFFGVFRGYKMRNIVQKRAKVISDKNLILTSENNYSR